ncbi:hypothetical protein [Streptomyces sp. NPDC002205]|uniref:hypothetical protein n=1 Tax=Streptomyces sp. NPDC002205 TaxID=3154411 RepID=UPI00331FEE24
MEELADRRPSNFTDELMLPAYREIAAGIHPRIHAAYIAIAVNYFAEVLELMPNYADASGQGKRLDPVTVYGNVGLINSEVSNSHISLADTVTNRRDTGGAAAAIRALTEAIQQDRELAEELRAQLLDLIADVADAAAAPGEPRRLNRARAAMAAITSASVRRPNSLRLSAPGTASSASFFDAHVLRCLLGVSGPAVVLRRPPRNGRWAGCVLTRRRSAH